jgi:hypothetical protein
MWEMRDGEQRTSSSQGSDYPPPSLLFKSPERPRLTESNYGAMVRGLPKCKSPALASLESTARANGLGLWGTPTPVAPRTFRKR